MPEFVGGFACAHCGETEFKVMLKENALHRYVCPKCKNVTYIYVSQNIELLMLREEEICGDCGGTEKCSKCNGTGKITCPSCEGKGFTVYTKTNYYGLRLEIDFSACGCAKCRGFGEGSFKKTAGESLRKGLKDGSIKLGSGKVDCNLCNGTVVCPSCGGYRFAAKKPEKKG